MDVIDIHPHIIAADTARYPITPLGGEISGWAQTRPVSFENMVSLMDKVGINKAVLVQAGTAHGFDNSYVADCIATNPKRFAAVGNVDLLAPDAPDRLSYWVRDRGLSGLRVFSRDTPIAGGSIWLDDTVTFPGWERARELQIPICILLGAAAFPRLKTVLERFPEVPVILDHMAWMTGEDGPPYQAADPFFALASYRNVYLKLTMRSFVDLNKGKGTSRSFLEKAVKVFGADHIAWGSNFPAQEESLPVLFQRAFDELAFLPLAEQEAILAGTALTLYPSLRSQ